MNTRRKLLSLVLVAVLSLVCLTATACNLFPGEDPTPTPPSKTEWPEAGVYYFDDAYDEYTLTLNVGDTFSLWYKGENLSGLYTLTDKNLVLDFTKEGVDNATATYEGDVITLTYGGATMRMLKKIGYTVSFNTNGGSEVAAQTVYNGKTAVKPADPTRENFLFVGWYADADFKTPYSFENQPITKDTTLFAQWSTKTVTETEFTVKLDPNYEGAELTTTTTRGGELFDLPTLERQGYTFGGWWFSNDNDGDKLSTAYTAGTKLTGDVTLYALWTQDVVGGKLPAPVVNVTAGSVSWFAIDGARSYLVVITTEDGDVVVDASTASTTYNVNFGELAAGRYEVKVVALAITGDENNSESVRYYANKALDKVSGFMVVEPSMLVYNTVANAQKYLITVNCGNPEHNHTAFDNGTSRSFNFANCTMTKEGITFTVTAVAEGFTSSTSETFVYKRELAPVSGLRLDEATQTLYWNEVAHADSYMVAVVCGNASHNHDYQNFGSQTFVSLKECTQKDGGIVIKIYPKTAGYVSADPVEFVYNKTTLETPSGLMMNGNVLSWNAITDKDGNPVTYEVKIGEQIFTVQTNSFDFTPILDAVEGVSYTVNVRAAGTPPSLWSDTVTAVYYEMGKELTYNKGTLTWSPVIGAAYYEISVNGGDPIKVEGGSFCAPVTLTQAGENTLKVRFVSGTYRSEWIQTTAYAHKVVFDTIGGSSVAPQFLAVGDPITLPTPTKTGYEFVNWYNVPGGAADNGLAYTGEVFGESGSIVLYAYYKSNKYEVTYNYGVGGSGDKTDDDVYFDQHYTLSVPTATDVAGAFGGWYSAPYGMGVQYTDANGNSIKPWQHTESVELYAFWIDMTLEFTKTKLNGKEVYAVSAGSKINLVTEITVPATFKGLPVALVAGNAFENCTSLEVINLPATIEQVSSISPFGNCTSLTAINVYAVDGVSAPLFSSIDGVLFSNDDNGVAAKLAVMPLGKTGTYRVPAGITEIPEQAFKGAAISKVVIPYTVVRIGREAFDGCVNLSSVVFEAAEAGVTESALVIGARAFRGCTSLEKINLPARLTDIKLQRYGIYEGEISTTDAESAFLGCTALKTVNVAAGNASYKSVGGVLYTKDGKTLVLAPNTLSGEFVIPEGVQSIAPGAFIGCTSLTAVSLPSTLVLVGECAFYDTAIKSLSIPNAFVDLTVGKFAFAQSSLTSITLGETSRLAVIGEGAFMGSDLESFTFPATLTSVGVSAFEDCSDLESVTFAANGKVLTFGADAFKNCVSLTTVSLPANVSEIPGVFTGCTSLSEVIVDPASTYFQTHEGVLYDAAGTHIVFFPAGKTGEYAMLSTATSIKNGTFQNIEGLTKLTIPASITSIGADAFNGADIDTIEFAGETNGAQLIVEDYAFQNASFGTLTLPSSTVSIGNYAFYNVDADEVVLNEGVTVIGEHAFDHAVVDVNVPASVQSIGAYAFYGEEDWWDGTFFPTVTVTTVGSQLKTIGAYAFSGNVYVEDVVIPASVESIANHAFYACTEIESITFEQNSQLKTIGAYAFAADSSYSNSPFNTVTIPKSVTEIGACAFKYTALESLYFEDGGTEDLVIGTSFGYEDSWYGYTVITGESFADCNNLATVVLPTRLVEMRTKTFYYVGYSAGTTSITFDSESADPIRLATIGEQCFYSARIATFTVPASVRNLPPKLDPVTGEYYDRMGIGKEAFYTYSKLTEVIFEKGGTEPLTIGAYAFRSAPIESIELPARLATYTDKDGNVIPALANGAEVFRDCSKLTAVTVEAADNATYITENGVLMSADKTELVLCPAAYEGSFTVPATVTKIYNRAFYGCNKLTELVFAEGQSDMTIGEYAFRDCDQLTTIDLPDNVVSIGDNAFYDCDALQTLVLSKNLSAFNGSMVSECSALATVKVGADESGVNFSSANGVLYNADKTVLVMYPLGKTETEFTVDANVKVIEDSAFSGNTKIEKVILPEGLVEINYRAFFNCTALLEVNVPSTVQLIGNGAFYYCYYLTTVTFAQDGDDLLILEDSAFSNCRSLIELNLPARLFSIGKQAFYAGYEETGALNKVTFAEGSKLTFIGEGAFEGASIHAIEIPAGTTEIGARAFFGNAALTSVKIGEGLISIGDNAFAGCSELRSVSFPASLKTLGASIFYLNDWGDVYSCPKLDTVTFAAGSQLERIPQGTFAYTALKEFTVPASVTVIEDGEAYNDKAPGAFAYCTELDTVRFEYGSACTVIGNCTFEGCSSLVDVSIPTSVATLGSYAFAGCESLESITLPETAVNLGSYLFANCYNLSDVDLRTKATALPSSMFDNCEKLTSIVIPAFVSSIDEDTFEGTGLASFRVDPASTYFKAIDGVLYTADGSAIVAFPPAMPALTEFTVPNSVTMISSGLFKNMTTLTAVYFEEGRQVELVIGDEAFAGCYNLKTIELPEGTTSIGEEAFDSCTSLLSFTLPSTLLSMGEWAFYGCNIIEIANKSALDMDDYSDYADIAEKAWHIYNPNEGEVSLLSVTEDGFATMSKDGEVYLVAYIGDATTVTIPEGVTVIATYAFGSNVESVTLSSTVKVIDDGAFYESSVKTVVLNEGLEKIGYWAFYYSGLESITFPSTLKEIAEEAFYGANLTGNITLPTSIETIGSEAFRSVDAVLTFITTIGEQPDGWASNWNAYTSSANHTVLWGFTGEDITYTFETNGGSAVESITSAMPITLPAAPVLEGYIFEGWFDNAEFEGTALSGSYYNGTKTTLYAKWRSLSDLPLGSTFERAEEVEAGQTYTATITEKDGRYYFVLTVEAGEVWKVTTSNISGSSDHRIIFYDTDQSVMLDYDYSTTETYTWTYDEAGTYYIAVKYYYSSYTGEIGVTFTKQ